MVVPMSRDDLTVPKQGSNPNSDTPSVSDEIGGKVAPRFEPRDEPFRYQPLDPTKRGIRLCKVLPQSQDPRDSLIRCEIAHYDLDSCLKPSEQSESSRRSPTEFTYIAVSYCWGDEEPSHTILVNRQPFVIRSNLFQFLSTMQDAKEHETLFWIDQLGIDQKNTPERNCQVQLMPSIYSQAQAVYAWLGEAKAHSALAFQILELYASLEDWAGMLEQFMEERTDDELVGFFELFTRSYWTRIWIVQEINLARKLFLVCGRERFLESYTQRPDYTYIAWASVSRLDITSEALGLFTPAETWARLFKGLQLLDKRHHKHHGPSYTWHDELYWSIADNRDRKFSDPRDIVYGIQASVRQEERIDVDYNKTVQQIFHEVVVKLATSGIKFNKQKISVLMSLRSDMGLHEVSRNTLKKTLWKWKKQANNPFSELT
jgi:hypothetical protein